MIANDGGVLLIYLMIRDTKNRTEYELASPRRRA
jgi:hypothetical protein